jgi:hypothetical protein
MDQFKALGLYRQVALIAGVLALVISFIKAYIRVSSGGQSANVMNAWDGLGTLAMLLLIVSIVIVAATAFAAASLPAQVPWTLVALALAAISAVILVIKPFTVDVPSFASDVSVGPGWSGWLLLALAVVYLASVVLLFRESGEKLPQSTKNGNGGGTTPSNTPPAA